MPIERHRLIFEPIAKETLNAWRLIPTSIASDVMNRTQAMSAAIKPVAPGMSVVGPARTVTTMIGDNSAIHVLGALLQPGDVMVVDARGQKDSAVWGEVMTQAVLQRGGVGAVVDGVTRDIAEIRALGFPLFCRGAVPRGPHKGFGGVIDGPIAVGTVPVSPGDLVLGDDDGVVVVPRARVDSLLIAARQQMDREQHWMEEIAKGRSTLDILGLPEAEIIEDTES
ncbi:MAG: RraA family protein [Rhodospirillales bacterium]|nr:RraA family protein [Rhodospirillales bacterium]